MGLIATAGVDFRDLSVAHTPSRSTVVDDDSLLDTLRRGDGINSQEAARIAGATFRQIDYWIRTGLACPHLRDMGSGTRRRYQAGDVEVLHALAQLSALGCRDDRMAAAADAVGSRRVASEGERLVVLLDGTTYRHPAHEGVTAAGPLWQVPLRSFAVERS